jgi:group II intron reverse transcriptase/maturase
MFQIPLNQIYTKKSLLQAFEDISKNAMGIDEVSVKEFKKELSQNIDTILYRVLNGLYTPEPLKKIEIDKPNTDEKRPIGLSSLKDKIVQKVLYEAINNYFDKQFSNKSYAYRKDKSTIKAINRVGEFINKKNHFVLKTDIDNFFESINHDKLLFILDKQIADKKIVRLISLFLQTGGFKDFDYDEHNLGVHQGDILSPLLSNIYLDTMDKFLEKYEVPFVRYADDFIILTPKEKYIPKIKKSLEKFLLSLDLKLKDKKTFQTHINDGFTFLGIYFKGKNKTVDNERFQKKISKLHTLSKTKLGFSGYIKELNYFLVTLKNYYLKIITKNDTQYRQLQEHLIDSIAHKVFLSKQNKTITTKKEFYILLEQIKLDIIFDIELLKDNHKLIVTKGYEKYLANKSYKETSVKIDKKKNKYSKKFAVDTTLHISTPGLFLGISKNKFTLKQYGKVLHTYPIDKIKRIILEGKGFTISSNVIQRCAKEAITIDFISRDAISYASLITYQSSTTQLISKQAMVLNTPLQLKLAKEFIKGKAKNQINYIKYQRKIRKLHYVEKTVCKDRKYNPNTIIQSKINHRRHY